MALRMASACSTWTRPSASAVRVCVAAARAPSASRTTPCAARRVVRVAAACQFAVEDAAVSPGRSIRLAWDSARAFELGELSLGAQELFDQGGGLGGVHRPHRHPRDLTELIAHASERPGDRVGLVGDRCHGPIPAPTTDTGTVPGMPLWTRDSGALAVDGKWTFQRALRWSRQARPALGERAFSAGLSRGPQPAQRHSIASPRFSSCGSAQTRAARRSANTRLRVAADDRARRPASEPARWSRQTRPAAGAPSQPAAAADPISRAGAFGDGSDVLTCRA